MTEPYTNVAGVMHDPSEVVPTVGMTGRYTLQEPYTALCNPNVVYTCTAVSSIAGAIAQGGDPLQEVYLANGDSQASYDADAAKNHCLVTLQAGSGLVITVPNGALVTLPDADGILYTGMMLGISLSALPVDTDLSTLKNEIVDLVYHYQGVRSTVYLAITSAASLVPHATHALVESARRANVTSHKSVRSQNVALQAANAALVARLAALESYIALNLPPP